MEDECAALRTALLQNEHYSAVSQATTFLGMAATFVKQIHSADQGVLFDATMFVEARSAVGLGIETVSITYLLHRLNTVVQPERSAYKRRALVKELRSALDAKGVAFGASVDAHVERLCAA